MSVFDLLGEADNLQDPEPVLNRQPAVYGMVFSFLILSTLCAIWRLWIRLFVTRTPGWDDVFVVLAVLCNIGQAVGLYLACERGLGQHFILLGLDGMQDFIRTFYIANSTYPMCSTFIKLALLFQYLRLFTKGTRLWIVSVITTVAVCLWGFIFTFMSWVPCLPVQAYWNWTIPDSQVSRYGFGSHDVETFVATYLTHSATNVALDLVIFTIPIPHYMEKGIQTRTRWALCGLFVLGAIVNASSICRLVSMVHNRAATYPTLDPSWYACVPAVLSALEVNLATICASLPVFWPVIEENLGRILVTREVDVRCETREFSTIDNCEDCDTYALDAVRSQKPYLDQRYMLSHIDPLQEEKPTRTTVIAMPQQAHPQANGRGVGDRSLDLGVNFASSLSGTFGLHRPVVERESKEVLLDA